jgi:type II secretory pathway pseudopilin PulG
LVELIGVMAVMAILASMTVPPILRQVRQAQSGNEDANLNEVARAIVEGIKATGTIPNPNIAPFDAGGWADVAYNHTTLTDDTAPGGGFAPGTLHYAFPSETAFAETSRRIYLDPAFLEYLDSQFNGVDPTKTFATPAGGWPATIAAYGRHPAVNFPNQAIRLYIVSSSRPDFVLSCSANGPNVQDAGNNYGNLAGASLIGQLSSWVKATVSATGFIQAPGAAVENWANNAHQYLHVKTVDLRPLFCRVDLVDYPYPVTATVDPIALGAGFVTPPLTVTGNIAGFSFDFISPAGTFSAGTTGNFISGMKNLITRTGATATAMQGVIPAPAPVPPNQNATFNVTITDPPWWDISPPILLGGQQMPANANNQAFYVVKGTTLTLYAAAAVLPAAPILTVQINSDSTFEYFNGSWTQRN